MEISRSKDIDSMRRSLVELGRETQSKRMRVDNRMPNDNEGFDGERRLIEIEKNFANQKENIRYHIIKIQGKWSKIMANMDVEYDDNNEEYRLIIPIGTKTYKVILEEIE